MESKTVICHLTSVHPAYDVRIFHKELQSLKRQYHCMLLHPGKETKIVEGIDVRGLNIMPSSRLNRFLKTVNAIGNAAVKLNASVYHLHDPELLQWVDKLQKSGAKVIYDAHEDLPRQIQAKNWIPKAIRKPFSLMVEKLENWQVLKCDGVVVSTPLIKHRFQKFHPAVQEVCNYPTTNNEVVPLPNSNSNKLIYVGSISTVRGIFEMLDIINQSPYELILAGKFSDEKTKHQAQQHPGWKKVDYKGVIPAQEIRLLLNQAFCGLVLLQPKVNYMDALPIKMFEYMQAGLPIVASNFPYWKTLLKEAGLTANPMDTQSIINQINHIHSNPNLSLMMGKNGLKYVKETYNWQSQEKKLLAFYHTLLENGKRIK